MPEGAIAGYVLLLHRSGYGQRRNRHPLIRPAAMQRQHLIEQPAEQGAVTKAPMAILREG